MGIVSSFIFYMMLYRVTLTLAGVVCVYCGYSLFFRSISEAGLYSEIKWGKKKVITRNVLPGVIFSLFGLILITIMLFQGNPDRLVDTFHSLSSRSSLRQSVPSTPSPRLRRTPSEGRSLQGGRSVEEILSLAERLANQGENEKAITAYRNALQRVSSSMNNLAWLYHEQKKNKKALKLAQLAVDLSPKQPEYLDTLAEIFHSLGRTNRAIPLWEKATRIDPRFGEKLKLKQ